MKTIEDKMKGVREKHIKSFYVALTGAFSDGQKTDRFSDQASEFYFPKFHLSVAPKLWKDIESDALKIAQEAVKRYKQILKKNLKEAVKEKCEHEWEKVNAVQCEHCGMIIED